MPVPVSWDVERAAELYRAGSSLQQLAVEFGVSRSSLHQQLVKAGVKMRPARLPLGRPDVDTDEIIRLRNQAADPRRMGRMSTPGVISRYRRATSGR